ncbi:MAG: hypothetical protein CSA29_03455 [Desulfobacterales bacterium]|nr:MAG: hypothetical protein CSA29_03455 [Desulfobacterales bacterium]
MSRSKIVLSTLLLLVVAAGCGYHLYGAGYLNESVTRVAVTVFENATAEGSVGVRFTNALIQEITSKTNTQVVADADRVLSGTVKSITLSDLSRSSATTVTARRVTAVVDVKLTDVNKDILWSVKGFSASETYSVVPAYNGMDEANKHAAVDAIAQRMAERLVNQMTNNF